jgi:hypothetical protein
MRNKTKKSKPSDLDKLKELQTLTLKRKKLQQDLEVLDYKIDQISPYSPDEHYDELDKVRKQLLYAKGGLILSVLIIAVLFNRRSIKKNRITKTTNRISKMIKIPVSVGELFDKITILDIKRERITEANKQIIILKEYILLRKIALKLDEKFEKNSDYKKLRKINDFLWDIEDGKRAHERAKDFGENFIHLAREVYIKNDERAKIKKSINKKYKSEIEEVKSHKKY